MTHRAEAFMHRYQKGKEIVMRGLGDVLNGNCHDNLAAIYFLKETGGAGKLAAIARHSGNSMETRDLAREALKLIADDQRFGEGQRELASSVVAELARPVGTPFAERGTSEGLMR